MIRKEEILALEEKFAFDTFTHQDAFDLAMIMLRRYEDLTIPEDWPEGLGIRIVQDGLLIFQYLMDRKDEDIWLRRKENVVEYTHHSSILAALEHEQEGKWKELEGNEEYPFAQGGFPLVIGGKYHGCISVSGMPGTFDHELLMAALEEFMDRKG